VLKPVQLTDVEAGGVTAFNVVGARIVPEKVPFIGVFQSIIAKSNMYFAPVYLLLQNRKINYRLGVMFS